MDWPAVVAFPAHPTVPKLESNENHSIEKKSRKKKGEWDMPEDWNKKNKIRRQLTKGPPLEHTMQLFNYKCLAGQNWEM